MTAQSAGAPTPACALPQFFSVDRETLPSSLVGMAFLAAQVQGAQPFVEAFEIEASVAPRSLLPAEALIERAVTTDTRVEVLARASDSSIHLIAYPRSTVVRVSAPTRAAATALASHIRSLAPAVHQPDTVSLRTWHLNRHGMGVAEDRRIAAPRWDDIAVNYPTAVRHHLQSLMSMVRPQGTGKLILWHGLPGTGKTTALRALMRAWESWCASQYVSDAERFFAEPAYISQVLTRSPTPRQGPTLDRPADPHSMWRLVIAEDSDEYLRASARRDAGAGLGRLLNLADGVLGQGFNTLILLTTNEELHHIHPALTRPGRSLARIEFDAFTPSEAANWLNEPDPPAGGQTTLAELYERRGTLTRLGVHGDVPIATGQYL